MLYNKVAVKVTAAKEAEGNPSEPPDDGFFMNGSVGSDNSASHNKAALMSQKLIISNIGKYHLL